MVMVMTILVVVVTAQAQKALVQSCNVDKPLMAPNSPNIGQGRLPLPGL